jgi:hypothetical protein
MRLEVIGVAGEGCVGRLEQVQVATQKGKFERSHFYIIREAAGAR